MASVLELGEAEKQLLVQLTKGEMSPLYVELPRAVGVDILDTVSSDLYKNPFHVVRELIQNSYDENAENVELLVTGGSVIVKDDGRGMDFQTLMSTRRLSESEKVYNPEKYPNPVRGFRKLGIYSGYQVAQRLELRTKLAGRNYELTLYLDFERMRKESLENRKRKEEERWDFTKLIENCAYVKGAKVDLGVVDLEESYTIAQLVNVQATNPDTWAKLSDSKGLAKYIVETFSLDFEQAFEHRAKIHAHLKRYVPGFHPFTIKLVTDEGEQVLKRPAITDVHEVKLVRIPKDPKQPPLAIGWIGRRKDHALVDFSARGIVFKVGGITIGGRTAGREGASTEHHYFYDRLTGEFHVIDPDIKPDPERANFNPLIKTNQLRQACNEIVHDMVGEAREDRNASNEQARAEKKAKKLIARWPVLKSKLDIPAKNREELIDTAVEVAGCLKELKSAQIAVSPQLAREATKTIQEMESNLSRAFETGTPAKSGLKGAGKKGKVSLLACLNQEQLASLSRMKEFIKLVDKVLQDQCAAYGNLYKTIVQVIKERWNPGDSKNKK